MQRPFHPICFHGFLSQAFFELEQRQCLDLGNEYCSKMKTGTSTEADYLGLIL